MIKKFRFLMLQLRVCLKSSIKTDYSKGNELKNRIFIFDKFNLKKRYNISDQQIINLTCGYPVRDFTFFDFQGHSTSESVFKANCTIKKKSKRIASFERTIDFQNMEIINDKMIVKDQGLGICTNAFLNQLSQAYKLGFKSLIMQAAGGVEYEALGKNGFQGYYVWAKYGYIIDIDEKYKFENWLIENHRPEKNLWEVCTKKESYEIWKEKGFDWLGTFEIYKKSTSFENLKKYLITKGINASSCNLPL